MEIGRGLVGARIIDVRDLWVVPGLIDLHVHLREPGQEYKEDIETGTRAAAAGGFTTICCMPNTRPVNDQRAVTELIVRRAREVGCVRVRPIGAISQGLEGKALADIAEMKEAGIVAISDDGRPVMNAGLLRRAFEYARTFDLPLVQHAEDLDLAEGGAMNEGAVATRIGIKGQPACAESAMVARDLEIVEWTGARYHVAHVSTARTVALVRDAKRRGLPVTCEVTPHHLALTDEACSHYDTRTKVMPPLRTAADQEALLEALADGTIDAIATDHAPHSPGREGCRVRVRRARDARARDRAADRARLRPHGLARREARDRRAHRRAGAHVRAARRLARDRRGRRPHGDRSRAPAHAHRR